MLRRALLTVALTLAMVLPATSAAVASGPVQPGSASLTASSGQIRFGGFVRLTGAIQSDPSCVADRQAQLQGQQPGQTTWTVLATKTTAADGSFAFYQKPQFSSSYQVSLPAASSPSGACDAVTSNAAVTEVSARVTARLSRNPLGAGNCTTIDVTVAPPRPGQAVSIQDQGPGSSGWQGIAQQTLDPSSATSAKLCYGWSAIGTQVPLRAVWTHQDDLNTDGVSSTRTLSVVEAAWMVRIDRLTAGHSTSVLVASSGSTVFERESTVAHPPASNEKLLLSLALLDQLGPDYRIPTTAAASQVDQGVVPGDLWILGHGNPEVRKPTMSRLAAQIAAAGIRTIQGSVMGSTGFFSHDWFAPGWKPEFPAEEVALPSALTFQGNQVHGTHVSDPERLAAADLTRRLRNHGVQVVGKPGAGQPGGHLEPITSVLSAPLEVLLAHQNFDSVNFDAEVLGKLLGVARSGVPGTISKGAAAIEAFAAAHGATVTSYDSSGLSYADRVTAAGMVHLLEFADTAPWGQALRDSLPQPGEGTLEDRLGSVPVQAKTGTLDNISALSGFVLLKRTGEWAEFSILSSGFSTSVEKDIEDALVRTVWRSAA
ncbi:MAG: D-alanyl-D-alanine carboxypeptidase [Actinomycetota bacterium]|nr:D-alanyl-D-alanine carboxypeptidase [Actinomycetota bacterium]